MSATIEICDLVETMQDDLKNVAPNFEGEKNIYRNDEPNRFVWVWQDTTTESPISIGGQPREIVTDVTAITVHCWGKTRRHALTLRAALLTSVEDNFGGAAYRVQNTKHLGDSANTENGFVAAVTLQLQTTTYAVDLSECGECGEDRIYGTKGQADTLSVQTYTPTTAGDGVLGTKED